MVAVILDGKRVAEHLKPQVRAYGEELRTHYHLTPGLAAILVGEDPASALYVRNKQRLCRELGFTTELFTLSTPQATTERLLGLVRELNQDRRFTGILVQLPLPKTIDYFQVLDTIDPQKDIDALTPANTLPLYQGREGPFLPCTPRGVLSLLEFYRIPTQGKDAVVIGRSDIAGKPLALLLGGRTCNATVTWCHSFTRDLAKHTLQADILVSCVGRAVPGRPFLITADMVREGAAVVDVGIRRLGKELVGDVDARGVREKAGYLTPVPGGVGPMTVISLMQNLLDAARYQAGLDKASYRL